MKYRLRTINAALAVILLFSALGFTPKAVQAANALRISQVYGGGGNSGATYTHDFIEIFNGGLGPVSLDGLSLQYASATGTGLFGSNDNMITELPNFILQPGQYFLVQEAKGSGGTTALPTPDLIDVSPINMAGTAGKVVLVTGTSSLGCNGGSTPCDATAMARIIDLVGFGGANFYETAPTAPTSNTTAAIRKSSGCVDTDNNSADFDVSAPTPRNSTSTVFICDPKYMPPVVVSSVPSAGTTMVSVDSDIIITFSKPVTVTDGWYDITCTNSGPHEAIVTDADPIYTLNPDEDFGNVDSCTVTVYADFVTDDDLDDPPDNMAADYSFTFYTNYCGQPYTPIYDVQGSGLTSPLAGTEVAVEGVVVGDFQDNSMLDNGDLNGFHIQDLTGDGSVLTSDGVFIYRGDVDVEVGDSVRVHGLVSEAYGMTEITASLIWVCSTGQTIEPTPLSLPVASVDDLESYEGMLVAFPQNLVIAEYYNFDQFGEIVLSTERFMNFTAISEPDIDNYAAYVENYNANKITLDDGRTASNPDPAIHPNGEVFNLTNLFRGGDILANVTGVMDYAFGLYRIQPTQGADYTQTNIRPENPDINLGELTVASFNVLNYFITLDDGVNDICSPSGTMECRGADTAEELLRQHNKIVAALATIDADIFGLMEIENESPLGEGDAVEALVNGLNAVVGAGTYDYIKTGAIGTDAIKVALIYKPVSVTPVGNHQILTSTIDPDFVDTLNRPTLAQVFISNSGGDPFVVAVNHLKSKSCPTAGAPGVNPLDFDQQDGAGCWNYTRELAAQAMVNWLDGFADVDNILIIGDLNSYDKEDPISLIKLGPDGVIDTDDDYFDMMHEIQGDEAYGYLYGSQIGYLDYALVNKMFQDNVVDVNFWHINADEPDLIDYDMSFKKDAQDAIYAPDAYRSSDHDPVIITLRLSDFIYYFPLIFN